MKRTQSKSGAAALGAALLALLGGAAQAQQVDGTNWGTLTAPVYGTSEKAVAGGLYSAAELLAGPNKAGELALPAGVAPTYFDGVLPNGKKVTPAGVVAQIGMHPLGSVLTPDGQFIIFSCDDERNITGGLSTLSSTTTANTTVNLLGGYSITVLRTSDMKVAAQTNVGLLFVGLQVVANGTGGYTVYASGGGDHNVKVLTFTPPATATSLGALTVGTPIKINPIAPNGTPTNFAAVPNNITFNGGDFPENSGNSGGVVGSASGNRLTFPAGSALSPTGRYLYVACNADNSLAVIDTATNAVIKQVAVGYMPYGVSVSRDGSKVLVSNWGVQQYSFLAPPPLDANGSVTALAGVKPGQDVSSLFFVPVTSTTGNNPKTSSVSIVSVPNGNPANAALLGSIYQGQPLGLDDRSIVGETHPSATTIVRRGAVEVEYVAKAGSDALGLIIVANNRRLQDLDLSPLNLNLDSHTVHGTYPNALAVSPDNTRVYVAEAGLNSVAVLDTTNPLAPVLLGRIPTGWYPTALSVSADGKSLYIVNDKGVGEDINPNTNLTTNPTASGVESFSNSNSIFGTLQKIDLTSYTLDKTTALANNYSVQPGALDTSIVPLGGPASNKIKHVIFILHENKTFDSMLGNQTHFGVFANPNYNLANGTTSADTEYAVSGPTGFTSLAYNTQALADTFATGVNYYSDAEESDGGHQFSASGTATDYTEKTLLVKGGRGLLANKNMEPEDYPEGGYIFNNAARNGVSFKDYGALIRVSGTDNGYANPAITIDPTSGNGGLPLVSPNGTGTESNPVVNGQNTTNVPPASAAVAEVPGSDVSSATQGLGQSYFLKNPILAILGEANANGEPHLDVNYPGYNFGISDQRRALEFNRDFDRMLAAGTLPQFIYLYQPNDHSGNPAATTNISITGGSPSGAELIADGDTALGMVVKHIMGSTAYYNSADGTGSAIFMTYDDAQSGRDHLDPHRTPMIVISPYARPGFLGTRHYSTASIVKTEELLLGLPPNNYGDLLATDLRDMFQASYNGIALGPDGLTLIQTTTGKALIKLRSKSTYVATAEGRKVWGLSAGLDSSAPDRDSRRLSLVTLLSMQADSLHRVAAKKNRLRSAGYKSAQARVYQAAVRVVNGPKAGGDLDGD